MQDPVSFWSSIKSQDLSALLLTILFFNLSLVSSSNLRKCTTKLLACTFNFHLDLLFITVA